MKRVDMFTNQKIIFRAIIVVLFSLPIHSLGRPYPMAAPEQSNGFHEDFKVILEGHTPVTHIRALDENFNSARVADDRLPWSDSYWPTYRGLIATRYMDSRLPNTKSWPTHHNFFLSNPPESYLSSGRINQLSPAEKYDILVGDSNWTLTRYMWKKGQHSYNQFGFVPAWTGICHGWAAASQVGIPVAENAVTVTDVSGSRSITFTHFDMSALSSYLWSFPAGDDIFVGRRCRNPNPPRQDGRITQGACFDNNPMTWHLATVNRVGAMGESFTIDVSPGTEVWNYVIDSYQLSYFNPASMEFSGVLEDAIVALEDFPQDPFKNFRGPQAKYIVGVMMDIFYPGAVAPHGGVPSRKNYEHNRFVYDLELDENFEVVGGEWHSSESPDFIWIYPRSYNPFLDETRRAQIDPDPSAPPVNQEMAERARNLSKKGRVSADIIYRILHRSLSNSP